MATKATTPKQGRIRPLQPHQVTLGSGFHGRSRFLERCGYEALGCFRKRLPRLEVATEAASQSDFMLLFGGGSRAGWGRAIWGWLHCQPIQASAHGICTPCPLQVRQCPQICIIWHAKSFDPPGQATVHYKLATDRGLRVNRNTKGLPQA